MSETNLYPGLNLGGGHGDAHEQAENTVFGFWVFLMSDLIIFGKYAGTEIKIDGEERLILREDDILGVIE